MLCVSFYSSNEHVMNDEDTPSTARKQRFWDSYSCLWLIQFTNETNEALNDGSASDRKPFVYFLLSGLEK